MRRLYIGVLALLRIDAATIDAVRRTSKAAVYGAGNASHASTTRRRSRRCDAAGSRTDSSSWMSPRRSAVACGDCARYRADDRRRRRPLGYETALYVAADVVAGPEFSCASLK